MRLTANQVDAIRAAADEVFGPGVEVWLFGSRTDDHRRGGDIDLLIRPAGAPPKASVVEKLRFLGLLERRIGERKVDVVIETRDDPRPIVRVAHDTGIRL
ncbi:nucleotidyltransferase domain-containing protein [Methylococcus sp. ANG]|uniref:nucleotidyltransferase domain-containing protein n=1 Tax=Methylococcus sp. ANG TaxID=3231903 RepID=UPI00345A918C